jgi:glycosyltransferase involved in cell wall biosynthesis
VPSERVDNAIRHALCLALPSRREGYGLVVVEASAVGTPSVVAAGPDNAAAELVEDGKNGFVAASASADDLAAAIVAVHRAGGSLRESTAAWFAANADRLSIESSLRAVLTVYADTGAAPERR